MTALKQIHTSPESAHLPALATEAEQTTKKKTPSEAGFNDHYSTLNSAEPLTAGPR